MKGERALFSDRAVEPGAIGGQKNAKGCHSEGSLGGRSDPAEIEGAMAANMAF